RQVFAGAAGHTYGHQSIWQMHSPKYPGFGNPKQYWYEALDAPSAVQMGYLRRLMESRPFLTQRPDLSLLAFEQTRPWEMCLALRGDGFALVYTPTGRSLEIALGKTAGAEIMASWFNPRTGETTAIGRFDNRGRHTFDPPGDEAAGNDWVLVLEDFDKAASGHKGRDGKTPAAAAQREIPIFEGLQVEAVGKKFSPDPARTVLHQSRADSSGNTSVRNTDRANLEWKVSGYYQRNRDLGQVFTAPRDFRLASIVLRTGPADAAVLDGAPAAKVFIEFFEVAGEPRIHDNGTPPGTAAKHGFSKNHRCDDYLAGVEYKPLHVVTGGVFPNLPPTRDDKGEPVENQAGCLTYLRWRLPEAGRLECKTGKRYAFMVGFEQAGRERGFTLANLNAAGVNAPPSLTDAHNPYRGGWAIRREGDGTLPPTMIAGDAPPTDADLHARLLAEALFPEAPYRFWLLPTTNGFPDVDTYRDLEFYLEADTGGAGSVGSN
ncbi:MAG: glycoside hydrolase family 140 protein, partial [Candidatus Sumerlaeia bacterium]|nr:glycoside hydrolase family 140 protein [Candidatus Sumerlaeia bacterium]